jgi:alpha/beta hydrolase fold
MKTTYFLVVTILISSLAMAQPAALSPERLQGYLKEYPDADSNGDGTLSIEEAKAYLQKSLGGKKKKAASTATPPPTIADVDYGPHDRNVLDFWQAKSDKPTPVVVFIHGGGFVSGDKSKARDNENIKSYLDAGVSFAAINYRYRTTAPIQDVLRDCARAIQFIRSKSNEWNIDKSRIGSFGGSAGAGTSLWLAFHDDLADRDNPDLVLRESTRITCVAATSTQFSYDIMLWSKLFGEENAQKYGEGKDLPGFYGLKSMEELDSPLGQKIRADCDMLGLITKEDAPVFLSVSRSAGPIANRGDYLHHPKHSQAVYDRCREVGVPVIAEISGLQISPPTDGPTSQLDFFLKYLKAK